MKTQFGLHIIKIEGSRNSFPPFPSSRSRTKLLCFPEGGEQDAILQTSQRGENRDVRRRWQAVAGGPDGRSSYKMAPAGWRPKRPDVGLSPAGAGWPALFSALATLMAAPAPLSPLELLPEIYPVLPPIAGVRFATDRRRGALFGAEPMS